MLSCDEVKRIKSLYKGIEFYQGQILECQNKHGNDSIHYIECCNINLKNLKDEIKQLTKKEKF